MKLCCMIHPYSKCAYCERLFCHTCEMSRKGPKNKTCSNRSINRSCTGDKHFTAGITE